jgi:biopolymer transport protein ExbB
MNSWLIYFTLFILLLMSIATWTIVVIKYRKMKNEDKESQKFLDEFWINQDWNVAQSVAKGFENHFATVAKITFQEFNIFSSLLSQQKAAGNIRDYTEKPTRQALQMIAREQEKGLSILASIGSTAPFVGLFGTVWGIVNALHTISASGQATIDIVAGPIGEALITTAIGIGVAIPSVIAYNYFLRRIKLLITDIENFSEDLVRLASREINK